MTHDQIQGIWDFWFNELSPKDWYSGDEGIDTLIRDRFLSTWIEARDGAFGHWLTDARGAMAYILLTDQFPRNMFRGQGDAFLMDANARATAKLAIDQGWDKQVEEPKRQFFYLPLMHSENNVDQDRSVSCFRHFMPETGGDNLGHAIAHRWIIRQFGRFPYRNQALSRESSPAEIQFLNKGGYKLALDLTRG